MRLSLGTMCRLRVTTKTFECVSGVVSMPLMRLHGVLSLSVADPDYPCKRKDLMGGIKKCIPRDRLSVAVPLAGKA
jgi:hypothetical protein